MVFSVDEILEKSKEKSIEDVDGVDFNKALKKTKFGKFHYSLIIISGIFMASVFFETMGITYVLPIAECDLDITSKQQYGIISGVWFAGIILTSHVWGFLSDTFGRKKILIVASLSAFCASVLSSLAMNFWQIYFGIVKFNFCLSWRIFGIKKSITIDDVCVCHFCSWLFNFTGNGLVGDKSKLDSQHSAYKCYIQTMAIIFDVLWASKFDLQHLDGNAEKTLRIMKKIYYSNTGKRDYPVYKIKPNEEFGSAYERKNVFKMMLEQTVTLFSDYPRSIILISLIQFGIYFVCNGMLLFFPDILHQTATYLENPLDDSIKLCNIVESAIEVKKNPTELNDKICIDKLDISAYYYALILESCYFVGFLLMSLLVNYVGRLVLFSVVFFSTGISGVLIAYVDGPLIGTYLFIWLLFCGVNNTLLNTVTYDLFPTNLRSLAMSLSLMFGRLAALIGGNVAGYLLESFCSEMFVLSGAVLILSGILTFFIPNMIRKK
ncbi:CLUMA_CG008123, isoform A [Clunio marinus]|uniref:CLUMA_CG008123, isoform A n=1 Tax=Clunio marinus TaxID=568069 RepID=A0A1J1I2P6_9DIPT|nr:CLUMA_CG008123, isoform A [Clunio marinus]